SFLADFALIESFVPWVHEAHARNVAFLEENVRQGDVVITHFVPHPRSVAPQYVGNPLNRFFVAGDVAPLLEARGARWGHHGHPPGSFAYPAGRPRGACTARGSPAEPGTSMNLELVIEV